MDYRTDIAQLSSDIVAIARSSDLTTLVPSCPGWTLGDLIFHLGSVHATWARVITVASPEQRVDDVVDDISDDVLIEWFQANTERLLRAMRDAEPGARCWTWWGEPRTVLAVERHQVQEAAVHLWDSQNALGVARAVKPEVASDGIAEFLLVHREGMIMPSSRITLRSAETDELWFVGEGTEREVTLRGRLSDLLLALHGRVPVDALQVQGNVEVAVEWLSSIDLT